MTAPTISPQVGSFIPGKTVSVSVTWGAGTGPDYEVWIYAMPTASCLGAYGSSGLLGQSGLIASTAWTESFVATSSDTHLCAVVEDQGTGAMLTSGVTSYSVAPPITSYIANDESAVSIDLGQSVQLTDYPSGGNAPYTYAWYTATGTSCSTSPPTSGLLGTSRSYMAPTGTGTSIPSTGTYYFQMWVTDSSITPVTTCETVTVTVNAALTGTFTIGGMAGQINGQVGSPALTAVVLFSGGTGPWYAVTIYSGTDSVCSADTTVVANLDDITGTEAIFSFSEPSTPGSITYYCATITDGSAGNPATVGAPGPIQLDISPALSTPIFSITPTATDYGYPKAITATVTWSGGTAPYSVYLVSGSQNSCAGDDQPVTPANTPLLTSTGTGPVASPYTPPYAVYTTSTSTMTFTFTSPASSTYYCAVVADSSIPPSVTVSGDSPSNAEPLFAVNAPTLSTYAVELLSPEYEGNAITASVTWSGGAGPYDAALYVSGTAGTACTTSYTLVAASSGFNPQTGLPGPSAKFNFLAPNTAGTYCYYAAVTDINGNAVATGLATLTVATPLASGATLSIPSLGIDTGQTATFTGATVNGLSGGNPPYTVTLYFGVTGATCTTKMATVTGSGASLTFPSFTSPSTSGVFCATISDSSLPASTGSTATVPWTISSPPTVTITGASQIAAGTGTTLTAIGTAGTPGYYFQWFIGSTCAAANAVTSLTTTPALTSTYNTGVISITTVYSVLLVDSSIGAPAVSNCSGDPVPSISTTLSQTIIAVGQSVTESATLAGVTNAGGTVTYQYFSGSTCSGTPTTVGLPATVTDGAAPSSATQAFSNPGYYSWDAVYSGDADNQGATSGCNTLTVSVSPMTLTLSCNHASVVVGAPIKCKATVQGSGSAPTGVVAWSGSSAGTFSSASCTLSRHKSYGTCSVKFTPAAAGSSVTITASYGGDSKNFPSAGTYSLSVTTKATKTTVSCTPKSAVAGSSTAITCRAKVTGYSPAGTVSWSQSGTGSVSFSSATCTLISLSLTQGTCLMTITGTTAGKVVLLATYSGDPNNQASSKTTTLTTKA